MRYQKQQNSGTRYVPVYVGGGGGGYSSSDSETAAAIREQTDSYEHWQIMHMLDSN
jgi:hypothetical protein